MNQTKAAYLVHTYFLCGTRGLYDQSVTYWQLLADVRPFIEKSDIPSPPIEQEASLPSNLLLCNTGIIATHQYIFWVFLGQVDTAVSKLPLAFVMTARQRTPPAGHEGSPEAPANVKP